MTLLRDYQTDIIIKTRLAMREGCKKILIQAPTGSGKTLLTAHMLKTALAKGFGSWFVVHRRELINQSLEAFDLEGLEHGVIAANYGYDPSKKVYIASIQSLVRRVGKILQPKLIVWDECHHIAAGSWTKVFEAFPNAYHIGLTATPERLDGKGLSKYFERMIQGPRVKELIGDKFLSYFKVYAPPTSFNAENVRTLAGDYNLGDLCAQLDKPDIIGDAVKEYERHLIGKRAICFCITIAHSKHTAKAFNERGIPCKHVDGDTPTKERDEAMRAFRAGTIKVLTNVGLFGEGVDVPALDGVLLLRPTKSLALYMQQVGRALRPYPGKEHAIILDHVENTLTHGFVDDNREWSLEGRERGRTKTDCPVRVCPDCYAAIPISCRFCPECGVTFKPTEREIKQGDGDLVEMDRKIIQLAKKKEQSKAQSLDDLILLGKQRGYRNPWAWARHVYHARRKKYG